MPDLSDELEALERAGWDSLCEGTGAEFYGRVMTDDGLMVLANGMVLGRDGVVASLREAPTWSSYELRDVRLVRTGSAGAALVYVGTAHRGDITMTMAMTSVYVREDDGWRLALYTQTPVPG
jgi:uncharacterized protein (TIGR02246 family)